jgi:hypothetical protein
MDIVVEVGVEMNGCFGKDFYSNISGVDVHWIKPPPKQGLFCVRDMID